VYGGSAMGVADYQPLRAALTALRPGFLIGLAVFIPQNMIDVIPLHPSLP